MMYKKHILLSVSLIVLQSCIGTRNMDYYSQEAYAERGVGSQDITPPPYLIPQQPQQANHLAQMQNQGLQMQKQAFQAQQQTFALNNTSNHSSNVSQSRQINNTGDSYITYLTMLSEGYYAKANYFASKGLSGDARLLQAKADSAKSGYDAIFETEESFNIPMDKKTIIARHRVQLENIKSNIDILQKMPNEIAILQTSFDCMVLEARNRMYSHTNACNIEYENALQKITSNFGSITQTTTEVATIEKSVSSVNSTGTNTDIANARNALIESDTKSNVNVVTHTQKHSHGIQNKQEFIDDAILKYKNTKSFVVYYNTGKANLDANAIYSINHAIAFAQDYDKYKINILGFTDRVASRDYNKSLSQKRAENVKSALIERGISPNLIEIKMFGEDYNAINTRDGVGESFNRRVVIEVEAVGKFDEDSFIMQKASENVVVE